MFECVPKQFTRLATLYARRSRTARYWRRFENMGSDAGRIDLKVKQCLEQAAVCDRHALEAVNKVAKETFAETAKAWRECATSFALLEKLRVN